MQDLWSDDLRSPGGVPAAPVAPPVAVGCSGGCTGVRLPWPRSLALPGLRATEAEAKVPRPGKQSRPRRRPRRKTVPRRASLVPTFVLSAILALVIGLSVYFGQDPGPDATKAPIGRLAGEPSTNRLDDAGRERR